MKQTYSEMLEEFVPADLVLGEFRLNGEVFEVTPHKLDNPLNYGPHFQDFVAFINWMIDYEENITPKYMVPEYPSRVRSPRA